MDAMRPHLDPDGQSVGTEVRISHFAATPSELMVTVQVEVEEVEGRRVRFSVKAHGGVEPIGGGTHERFS